MINSFSQIDKLTNYEQKLLKVSDMVNTLYTNMSVLQRETSNSSHKQKELTEALTHNHKQLSRTLNELNITNDTQNKELSHINSRFKEYAVKDQIHKDLKDLRTKLETHMQKMYDRLDYVHESRIEQLREIISVVLDQSVAETEKLDMLTTVLFSTLGTYNTLIEDQNEKLDLQYWINWGFTGIAGILTSAYIYDHWDLILGAIK